MLMRFTKERQSQRTKRSKYHLDEDGDDVNDIKLTHNGREIDDYDVADDFKGKNMSDEDPEDRYIDDEIVNSLHF